MIYKEFLSKINPKFIFRICMSSFSCFMSNDRAYAFPIRAEIENGAGCNLRCEMCAINKMKRKKGFLTFENFKKIFDQINPPYLNLTGYTESFLNKDIFKMIDYGKKKGSFIKLDSNATILTKEIISNIINSGAHAISISVDGSNEKIYGNIRKGGKLNVVLENLQKLVTEKYNKNSQMKISVAIVVQKNNIKDLINIIKIVDKIGVDDINPTPIVEYDIKDYEKFTLQKCITDLQKVLQKLKMLKTKTKVNWEPLKDYLKDYEKGNLKYKKEHCFAPWYNTYITWEGDVVPCCYHYDNQKLFGNVFQEDFKKIWNNQEYRKFRKEMMKKGRTSDLCQTCRNNEKFIADRFNIPILRKISSRKY